MPLRVGVIVEGHGDDGAIRPLLERIWYEMLGGDYLEVMPWRGRQGQLLQEKGLKRAVEALAIKLSSGKPESSALLILILMDSEKTCPKELAPKLIEWAKQARSDFPIACALPHPMFETWFVASAASLSGYNDLPENLAVPDDPEGNNLGKGWIKNHLPRKYSETVDQPRFVTKMNLDACRERSPSFDKLCREMKKALNDSLKSEPR